MSGASKEPAAGLPVVRAADLEESTQDNRWLVDAILPRSGVSICGGAPKCCKSWMGLDLALSVASGTACLGRFPVAEPAGALIYLAEDPPAVVRDRLGGICRHRGLDLRDLPIDVITSPSLRLDLDRDQLRLSRTIRDRRPRLVVLDPFVRLHRIDENSAGEVSALLAYLRELQREHDLAIVIVHHARKNGAAGAQAGQGLRGSGDFYAFVDSLFYLRRQRDRLELSVEHRAAPAPAAMELVLAAADDGAPHLEIADGHGAPAGSADRRPGPRTLDDAILRILAQTDAPLSRTALRATLHCRTELLEQALDRLAEGGLVARSGDEWARAGTSPLEIDPARAA